jgi:hypothetical protein
VELVRGIGPGFTVELPASNGPPVERLGTPGTKASTPLKIQPGDDCYRNLPPGSVGCLLKRPGEREASFFLTGEHVIWGGASSSVYTKGINYPIGKQKVSSDILGQLPPIGDWTLVELEVRGNPSPNCRKSLTFKGTVDPATLAGKTVEKCGYATGRREGKVCAANWCAYVRYKPPHSSARVVRFENHIVVKSIVGEKPFAYYGDSGAVVYLRPGEAEQQVEAVGILVAATSNFEYALVLPLGSILADLPTPYSNLELA